MLGGVLFALSATAIAIHGQELQCFVPGSCETSSSIGISFPSDANGCLADCKTHTDCEYFTYDFIDDTCLIFSECQQLVDTDGTDTISGEALCDYLVCDAPGECEGVLLNITEALLPEHCLNHCVEQAGCTWWSYNNDTSRPYCSLYANCVRIDTSSCTDCHSGQKECKDFGPLPLLTLVIFGEDGFVDVVSLEGKTCDPIADMPLSPENSYSFVTDGGKTPNVCSSHSNACLQYDGNSWNYIDSPSEDRWLSAGAQIDLDTYWVMGGYVDPGTGDTFRTSSNSWSLGPDPPLNISHSCAVTHNNNDVYILGGFNDDHKIFYLHDWSSGTVTHLVNAPWGHLNTVCGLVQSSRGLEFVAAGNGESDTDIDVYSVSSDSWRNVGQMPAGTTAAAYVQLEETFLYMGGSNSLSIYEWDPDTDSFFERPEKMNIVRDYFPSAIAIDGTLLNCY